MRKAFRKQRLTVKEVVPESARLSRYRYARKRYIMSQAENTFFTLLKEMIGDKYEIFPQVHIDKFLDYRIEGQDFRAAHSVIQRKSVDFLICSIGYRNPLVAIELDDSSHNRPERIERDKLVNEICRDAGMPLLRVAWKSTYDTHELFELLKPYLTELSTSDNEASITRFHNMTNIDKV